MSVPPASVVMMYAEHESPVDAHLNEVLYSVIAPVRPGPWLVWEVGLQLPLLRHAGLVLIDGFKLYS